jgi:hypothetical protein
MDLPHRALHCYSFASLQIAVMVEFAHRNVVNQAHPAFARLGYGVASHIAFRKPRSTQELLRQVYLGDVSSASTVEDAVTEVARLLGDRIIVTRFIRWSTQLRPELDPAVAKKQERA